MKMITTSPNKVCLLVLLLVTLVAGASAQIVVDLNKLSKKSGFHVDLASFYTPPSKQTRLELYYKIYNHQLTFAKAGEDYQASYEVRAVVLKKGRQVAGTSKEEDYAVPSYSQSVSSEDYFINQFSLELEPGKYDIQVTLVDKKAQKGYNLTVPLTIRDYAAKELTLSDIEFAEEISDSRPGSQFNKAALKVVPQVKQSAQQAGEDLKFYFEAYARKPQPIRFEYATKDYLNKTVQTASEMKTLNSPRDGIVGTLRISGLPAGRYTLVVSALGNSGKAIAQTKQNFEIDWSIDYYIRHDFRQAIELIRYIATAEETKALKNTPSDSQAQAWKDFWKGKDPTPDTPENEVEQEYYRRMRYANDNYTNWAKPGWKTDFGMVYMKYGEPDEIDRHPFDRASRSYEVWYYYALRKAFTFLDDGYGEYRLQYPYDGDIYRTRR